MNLKEKEIWLREEVAYPSVDEYDFDGTDTEMNRLLAGAVNKILAHAFETASAKDLGMEEIVSLVYKSLRELQRRYYDFGLCAPKIYRTIARFWGLNYGPEIYLLMRFPPEATTQADRCR